MMVPHATGLSRLSLGLLAATTSAGTAAHRIVHRTEASNPFTFQEAYAEAAAWVPDPVQPGETRREVRTRVDESAKCLPDSEIVPETASPNGSVGRSRRSRASNARGPLTTAAEPEELAAGRHGGHLATEGRRYLLRHRGAVCRADGASALGTESRSIRLVVKTHAACRSGLRVVRAIATEGAQGRARNKRLPTRLGDLARHVRQDAGSCGEFGVCERVSPGVARKVADPDEIAVEPTPRTVMAAAGRVAGSFGLEPASTMALAHRVAQALSRLERRHSRFGDGDGLSGAGVAAPACAARAGGKGSESGDGDRLAPRERVGDDAEHRVDGRSGGQPGTARSGRRPGSRFRTCLSLYSSCWSADRQTCARAPQWRSTARAYQVRARHRGASEQGAAAATAPPFLARHRRFPRGTSSGPSNGSSRRISGAARHSVFVASG